ncbi:riboflavin kinase / FMN adenylyltransferase [Synechococcus sp. PROS-7-1]|uniref:bifunctional riboflavin kinase/FAD synthetase n=1 Tax=Synechococcus sp. PROS-7-1 TaxID=1442556 RepID=UPI00164604E2|nr:bifunctional riboflavin kinase/FAD synthetase [Synechococcus sp. PROS-7-1]QNI85732.1 riboflavin kinase / FMN adenylyltransferase [Synechococcus sp. PROS-7-1]
MIPLCSPQQARTPTALALGSFDGLHAGHRRVIKAITTAPFGGHPTVVSFWPHPREVLHGEPRLRLDLPDEKLHLLEPLGIEQLVLVPFTKQLAQLSAADFVEQVLLATLQARHIAVGANFRFGRGREGDTNTLAHLASAAGVKVSVVPILEDEEGRMSSSRIRAALSAGELHRAANLLGRAYRFQGEVVRGRGLGRGLGWPTANLQVDGRKFLPGLGVYAAWAWVDGDGTRLPAVMNLGPQPTVDPGSPSAVEVHLLDFEMELEGRWIKVEPVQRLRGQQRFSGLKELSAQIGRDAVAAKEALRAQAG